MSNEGIATMPDKEIEEAAKTRSDNIIRTAIQKSGEGSLTHGWSSHDDVYVLSWKRRREDLR
jgi:hypothetical protein